MSPKSPHDASLIATSDRSSRLLSFIVDEAPAPGSATEIADGVFWLRFSLPMKGLDHINLWALKDGDGWVIVDTGIGNRESKAIWTKHFTELMGGRPVNRVICTHLHPDHTDLRPLKLNSIKPALVGLEKRSRRSRIAMTALLRGRQVK